MAERLVRLADSADRELARIGREMGLTPEAVAQDAIEHYVYERRNRSAAFEKLKREAERKLGMGE